MTDAWVDDVVRFWFVELAPRDWWRASPAIDERVRARFGTLHESLAQEPPTLDRLDARGHLAAAIVFDQFARHLHRGAAQAFATDPLALAVTDDAIDRGLDRALEEPARHFLYMPLMHSEDLAVQARSLAQFGTLGDREARRAAADHHATIRRFGRFPARNAALGRQSTDAECVYLAKRSHGVSPSA